MGHKAHPRSLRIGITTGWMSRWFSTADYARRLREDVRIREMIFKKCKGAGIADVEIERNADTVRVIIRTSRPGVLIGRAGSGIDQLTAQIKKTFFAGRRTKVNLDVAEVRHSEESAMLVARQVAEQLEKRMPFRRVLKNNVEQVVRNRDIKGVKIEVSGRLNGAEMSRREWLSRGTIPLHTLRANIDFARVTAVTTYGAIGVKVWISKGEVFGDFAQEEIPTRSRGRFGRGGRTK